MSIQLFWQITKRSYQRYLTYRAATLAGLLTNLFFGILRASILVALYGGQKEVDGITINAAVTYAAMTHSNSKYGSGQRKKSQGIQKNSGYGEDVLLVDEKPPEKY